MSALGHSRRSWQELPVSFVRSSPKADINSACSDGTVRAELPRSARVISDLDFFSDGEGVVDLDTEVPHRTLDFGVAKQELYGAQVARPAIDQGRLRAPERVRAEHMRVQPDACNPVRNKARVLPRGHALSRPPGARKQKFVTFLPGQLHIGINGFAGVVGAFEPGGTSSLFLTRRRTGDRMPIGSNVFDLERNDIASPQLAIDSKIEQCQFEDPPLDVEFGPDRPDVFGPERRLGPD